MYSRALSWVNHLDAAVFEQLRGGLPVSKVTSNLIINCAILDLFHPLDVLQVLVKPPGDQYNLFQDFKV